MAGLCTEALSTGSSDADPASYGIQTHLHHLVGPAALRPPWEQTIGFYDCELTHIGRSNIGNTDNVDELSFADQATPGINSATPYVTDCYRDGISEPVTGIYNYSVDQATNGVQNCEVVTRTSDCDQGPWPCFSHAAEYWTLGKTM